MIGEQDKAVHRDVEARR